MKADHETFDRRITELRSRDAMRGLQIAALKQRVKMLEIQQATQQITPQPNSVTTDGNWPPKD